MIWMGILIFFLDMFVSYMWAKSVKAISQDKAVKAAISSVILSISGAISIIGYTTNKWLLIPAILGGGIGTYLAVKYKKDDDKN